MTDTCNQTATATALLRAAVLIMLLCAPAARAATATIAVVDDSGKTVTLAHPARRVISMAPHVTELLFAAGAGARIVGVMNFSDYPEAAKRLPLVGSNADIDIERVIALQPDLLIAWESGNTARQLAQLAGLGIPIFYSEPRSLDAVATSLTRLGRLLGTEEAAGRAAGAYRARLAALAARYGARPPVRVFYQVWDKPLYTFGGKHIVNDALALCGGRNIFADLAVLAPEVGVEAVLQRDPEAIVGGDVHDPDDAGLNIWKPYKGMQAVRRGNLFPLGGELLTRAGPRMADGAASLCEKLELARQRRPSASR